jgi:nitroreductase
VAAASTVPDHGGLRPWRFVLVADDARDRFADALADAARERDPIGPGQQADKIRRKAYEGPASIVVIAKVRQGKVPEWEQTASAACAGFAVTLAAHALGLGAVWKSVPDVDAPALRRCFDLTPDEKLLGWIHVGHHAAPPSPKKGRRPQSDVISALAP